MNRLRKRFARWGIGLSAILIPLSLVFPVLVAQIGTYVLATLAHIVAFVWVRLAWKQLRDPDAQPRPTHFTVGIAVCWVALVMAIDWTIASYIVGETWMLTSPIVGIYVVLLIVGAAIHMTTPDRTGHVPKEFKYLLIGGILSGLALGIAVAVLGLERGIAPSVV